MAAVVIVPLVFASCDGPEPAESAASVSPAREAPDGSNLLFIVLDAARARNFGVWGYHRDTTPNMDALAKSGVYFVNAYAQSTNTPNSVESYFSGRYFPLWRAGYARNRYTGAENLMPLAFQAAGYQTAGFSDNPFVTHDFKFDTGFDHFEEFTQRWSASKETGARAYEQEADRMFDAIRSWIKDHRGEPWFGYVHLLRPHEPYIAPKPYGGKFVEASHEPIDASAEAIHAIMDAATPAQAEALQALYDGNLSYADALVGALADWLHEQDEYDDTWIVIAADHGEAFMEHGRLTHGGRLFDEEIHVPLIVKPAKGFPLQSGRVEELVAMVDLFPTFVDVFGLERPETLDGQSLVKLLQGEEPWERTYIYGYRPIHRDFAVRSQEVKFLGKFGGSFSLEAMKPQQLFDLVNDPGERRNTLDVSGGTERYYAAIAEVIGAIDSVPKILEPAVDAERKAQLEAVGYID